MTSSQYRFNSLQELGRRYANAYQIPNRSSRNHESHCNIRSKDRGFGSDEPPFNALAVFENPENWIIAAEGFLKKQKRQLWPSPLSPVPAALP
jgi:hypothetical protein